MANPEMHRKVGAGNEDSPDRCQGILQGAGQCTNARIEGSNFCIRHGGHSVERAATTEGLRNYRLTRWRERVNQFADNPQAKSLREEIGITRLQLENLLNRCQDENDLLMYSNQIEKLVNQIEKLVTSCQKLEEKTGSLVDKTQLMVMSDSIVKILADFITNPDDLDMIGMRIIDVIAKPQNESLALAGIRG